MKIRKFEKEDAPYIAKIEQECFSDPWSERSIISEAESGSLFFVAEEQTITGYISCKLLLDEGYINNIAITKDYRNKGIGKMLLKTLIRAAENKKASFLTLEVRKSNTPAISLYKSLGFQEVGERKNFYCNPTEDALLLTLFLGEQNENSCH